MQNYSHEHLTHFLLFLVLKCSLVKTIVNCGYHRYLLTKLFVGSALVSVMYGFLSNLHLRATVWSYSNWIGQDQRSDHCGARTHDYCLSAGKQQPPTAQATPTGTPAPLHTHSKTLVKPLQLVTTQNKARTFRKMTQYQQTPRSGHLSKANFPYDLQVFKQYPTKKGGNPLHIESFSSLPYFGYSLSPFD